MRPETKAVHAGDRKRPGSFTPVTTPIYAAVSYFYDSMEQLDRVFANEEKGPSYARHDNPTTSGLEELISELENGHGAIACASGMSALHLAITTALLDRPKRVLAANAIYGATMNLLNSVFAPFGVEVTWVDFCDLDAVEKAVLEVKPGCLVMETVSNPLLRVADMERVAAFCTTADIPLIVDSTFATPMLVRPIELGASFVVHSSTKFLGGHGDAIGGLVVADSANFDAMKSLSKTIGGIMSPFESYLTMRGIKTLALRVEKQCRNAVEVWKWLSRHPRVERTYFPGDPRHPDTHTVAWMFPQGMYGSMISFELKHRFSVSDQMAALTHSGEAPNTEDSSARGQVFHFMDKLKMIVRATSLGDVHTMVLYPAMSTHRDLAPKQRERLGIKENLVRLSVGIEAAEDIIADLEQALT
jgi:cystathionine gamma-synthase/methionine-gamma-lyase